VRLPQIWVLYQSDVATLVPPFMLFCSTPSVPDDIIIPKTVPPPSLPEAVVEEIVPRSVPDDIIIPETVPPPSLPKAVVEEIVPPSVLDDIIIPETVPPPSLPDADAFDVPIFDTLTSPPSLQSNRKRSAPPSTPRMVRIITNDTTTSSAARTAPSARARSNTTTCSAARTAPSARARSNTTTSSAARTAPSAQARSNTTTSSAARSTRSVSTTSTRRSPRSSGTTPAAGPVLEGDNDDADCYYIQTDLLFLARELGDGDKAYLSF
jgi:hypothetical protein